MKHIESSYTAEAEEGENLKFKWNNTSSHRYEGLHWLNAHFASRFSSFHTVKSSQSNFIFIRNFYKNIAFHFTFSILSIVRTRHTCLRRKKLIWILFQARLKVRRIYTKKEVNCVCIENKKKNQIELKEKKTSKGFRVFKKSSAKYDITVATKPSVSTWTWACGTCASWAEPNSCVLCLSGLRPSSNARL